MSRNMRRRSTPPPARKVLASSSQASQNSDYDDDYGGVDDISSGEEDGDEPNVEGAEERDIISSEHTDDLAASRPAFIEDEEPWEGFGMDTEILGTFFEQEMQNGSSFGGSNNEAAQIQKHVRWEFPQESDSETIGSQSGAEWYTDLFMEKDALDHQFCQLIDRDDDTGRFSDDGFYYDDAASDEDASSDQSNPDSDLSGYDTDESGMTTDEEDTPVRFIPPQRSVLRATSEASTSSEEVTRRRVRRDPVLGTWNHKSDTPYAIYDNDINKVRVFNLNSFRRRMNLQPMPGSSFATPRNTSQHGLSPLQASPMISNSGNIMMSAMMPGPFDHGISGPPMGPIEAYYPWTSVDANGTILNNDSSSLHDSDDFEDENLWNIHDMIDLGDDTSEGSQAEADPSEDCPADASSTNPARPTTARSEEQVHPLLHHFSSGNVGSFRANQDRHSLLNRGLATADSLAFGISGTIRGVKAGRLQHANAPITPVRKQKRPVALESSPASPSPFISVDRKRKFKDGERSINPKRIREM